MTPAAIIAKKRDQQELSAAEIRFMIEGLVDDSVPDYQISAWAMAILCRGMSTVETAALTDCMLESGRTLARTGDRPRVDKHSTGGLGDKVSLILAPLLACFEVDVPMLSGRGLGITGGTLDKLEAYPGYRCDLTELEITRQLGDCGCVITGTTPDVAPADRKLYLLRDVTGTVPSIPLITASIMSKKLAANLDALVLDVKCGSAAFMQTMPEALALAESLVATGQRMGVATQALITDMNQPLGRMVGNACEANESVQVLKNKGPADVQELVLQLCSELLVAVGKFTSPQDAIEQLKRRLASGDALQRYERMLVAQGADYAENLPLAPAYELCIDHAGWLARLDGQAVGQCIIELGGGRKRLGDAIDHGVGLEMLVRIGDTLDVGQPLLRVFARNAEDFQRLAPQLSAAMHISETPPVLPSLITRLSKTSPQKAASAGVDSTLVD